MAQYPDAIFSPRVVENRPGVVFDPLKTKVLYAEDKNNADDEIVAIETELGANPKGGYADVAGRLEYLENNIGGGSSQWTTSGDDIYYTTGNVGIGTDTPLSWLHLGAGTESLAPLIFDAGPLLASPLSGAVEFFNDVFYGSVISGNYTSQYPVNDTDHVKATTYYSTDYYPHFTTDTGSSLVGIFAGNQWISQATTEQRFHIDLGESKTIIRVYYENAHYEGTITDYGAKNFTFWGSNDADDFNELTYATDGTWTQLTTSISQLAEHSGEDAPDPKYFDVTNSTGYRYYAFKFADNWGSVNQMGVRRIELQDGSASASRLGFVMDNGTALTDGRVPFADSLGHLTDDAGFSFSGSVLNVSGAVIGGGTYFDSYPNYFDVSSNDSFNAISFVLGKSERGTGLEVGDNALTIAAASLWGTNDTFFQALCGTDSYGVFEAVNGLGTAISSMENMPVLLTPNRTERMRADADGIKVTGDVLLETDSDKVILGTGEDMSIYYDGTDGYIKTNDVAASDLHVSCGTDKTLVLDESVWDDISPIPILNTRLGGANQPSLATLAGNIQQYTFAVNDYVYGAYEIPHTYKEGTDLDIHVHWVTNGSEGSAKYVEWEFEYSIANVDGTFTSNTPITSGDIEIPINTPDRTHMYSDITSALDGSTLTIGAYILYRFRRIAAEGTAPVANPFALALGIHIEQDTLGSREELIK